VNTQDTREISDVAKYSGLETTHEVFKTLCAAGKKFSKIKRFHSVKMFECEEIKSKENKINK